VYILSADDPDSAGGGTSHLAGSTFGAPVSDSTVPTPAAMDSAGSHHERGIHDFFLTSDADEQIGMSRVAVDPNSDDEVLAEILFRGKYISGAGIVVVDKLPDDEIVDPRVKVENVDDEIVPPRSRRKHRGVRSDDFLWDKPVEDFFSSESESDDDMKHYIPPLPYGEFKDWEMVSCPPGNNHIHVLHQRNRRYFRLNPEVDVGLDLWRDVNMLCQSLHSDDVEDFWRTQDEWIFYPIRATLLKHMLRHRLTVPPSYCRDIVVAGNIIQTVQDGLRQAYECIASAPIACTARQMVFSSPWLTAKKESGSPLQTALVWDINEFFLASDEEEQIGMSRVVADPDSDDEVIAEIIFRGKSISGDGVVFGDKLPDDEIVDPRVKVEPVYESAYSPPRSRRKHLRVRSDDFLWDKPIEDFFSS
ncbi:hypothetical protein Tco_1486069, partial [Tanacetum coccineum]